MKECWDCGNYKVFYTRIFCRFEKTKMGFCNQHNKPTKQYESCEYWKKHIRRKITKPEWLAELNKALSALSAIKLILSEENTDIAASTKDSDS